MYSPKIQEEFIPVLYRIALCKKIPMTRLVKQIIKDYLEKNGETGGKEEKSIDPASEADRRRTHQETRDSLQKNHVFS